MSTHHYVFLGSDGHSGWTKITNIADTRLDFLGSKYSKNAVAAGSAPLAQLGDPTAPQTL